MSSRHREQGRSGLNWIRNATPLLAFFVMSTSAQLAPSAANPPPVLPEFRTNNGPLTFAPVSDHVSDTAQPQLGNGVIANVQKWPASLVATAAGETCTATLVGQRTLLTAAHCVGDGEEIGVQFDKGSPPVKGTCSRAPGWTTSEPSNDWALCLMKEPVKRPGLVYELVSLDPSPLKPGLRLTAGGYGCQDLKKQKLEFPPVFRIGSLVIDRPPVPGGTWPNWIFTVAATDTSKSFVCPGDSGGAVYWVRADQSRLIVAVASAVQTDPSSKDYKVSYLAAVSTTAGKTFIEAWATKPMQEICGLSPGAVDCRPAQM